MAMGWNRRVVVFACWNVFDGKRILVGIGLPSSRLDADAMTDHNFFCADLTNSFSHSTDATHSHHTPAALKPAIVHIPE
jgi:hypothetical protein